MKRSLFVIVLILLFGAVLSCQRCEDESLRFVKVGVMLPFSGEYGSDWNSVLDWAVDNINCTGGIAGRKLVLDKRDIGIQNVEEVAQELAGDPLVTAAIGPLTSSQVYQVTPKFINQNKLLIAPVATSASISKAFSSYNQFWRLSEPDVTQMKTLLLLAQSGGARKVALITEESDYGASFEDWFGFFATELDMEVSGIQVIEPGIIGQVENAWNDLVDKHPDAIIAAINSPIQCAALARSYRENGQQIRLLFSDAASLPSLISELGPLAENLEGLSLAANPLSGFEIAYKVRFGQVPGPFLAQVYDAVLLIALALEAYYANGEVDLVESMKQVVLGTSGKCGWNRDEMLKAKELIRQGVYPDVYGASGSLDFDQEYFTDVISSTYGHWCVHQQNFIIRDYYTSDGNGRVSSTSASYRVVAERRQIINNSGNWKQFLPAKRTQAFLMGASKGWDNYRHQADVLRVYQLLKEQGMTDEDITLIIEDDIAFNDRNLHPGRVYNEIGGRNLYENVEVDYRLSSLDSKDLENIFANTYTDSASNLLIFTSGHGTPGGMVFDGANYEILTPEYWNGVFDGLYRNNAYRQVFWSLEACYSGFIGQSITQPGILIMTGANAMETSKAWLYDTEMGVWLGDKFALSVNHAMENQSDFTFMELFEYASRYVSNSHVMLYNYQNFGNIFETQLKTFIHP